ncbi:MAG: hypothetical protein M1833_001209 [Piccolia ochrophora]|nr:MAG: hypothetical protein M1833_001209 [Piccolia ochrophora]
MSYSHRSLSRLFFIVSAAAFSLVVLFLVRRYPIVSRSRQLYDGAVSKVHLPDDDINNATLGFGQILVVNMPSRTDHRDALSLAAALSKMRLDWVDGVHGKDVLDKVMPPGLAGGKLNDGSKGAWRAHLNALSTPSSSVIQQNISSALIFEDDVDWDWRIRSQLRDFAKSSRALLQPLKSEPSSYADKTYQSPKDESIEQVELQLDNLPPTLTPHISPYGDAWDVLWLGHCGMRLPSAPPLPRGRVIHEHDDTVPEIRHLSSITEGDDNVKTTYPAFTRVVHHARDPYCSLAYAVTQSGARRILYQLGIKSLDGPFDVSLKQLCEGSEGREHHTCLAVSPPFFTHHRPRGSMSADSDITSHGDEVREQAVTGNIQQSVKMNFEALLRGDTTLEDQFPP